MSVSVKVAGIDITSSDQTMGRQGASFSGVVHFALTTPDPNAQPIEINLPFEGTPSLSSGIHLALSRMQEWCQEVLTALSEEQVLYKE
ncbi:MAG: hypothetical protein ACLP7P_08760 [Rhodomicrobium sp.]